MERNREAFGIIKSIDSAAIQIQTNAASTTRSQLRGFLSAETIKNDYPSNESTILLKSLRILYAVVILYTYNLISTIILTLFKFQIFSIFSLLYAATLLLLAPFLSFFACHYPLMTAASFVSRSLAQKGMVCVGLLGLLVQSLFWILIVLGLMSGASGGIFTILGHLNSKEWPLFIIGLVNMILLTGCLLYSLYLKQEIARKYLLQ